MSDDARALSRTYALFTLRPGPNLLPIGYYINKEADSLKASDESDIWKGLIVTCHRSSSKSRTPMATTRAT